MTDPTAFAMAFMSVPAQIPDAAQLELDTHNIKTEPDTQQALPSYELHTDAYPSPYPGLTLDVTTPYQLSQGVGSLPVGPAIRPPPLNLGQHSNTFRINSVASGPITPCTPYLPLTDLSLQAQTLSPVNSSPMSQPLSAYSTFSSLVSPTLSSPSSYSNASQDVFGAAHFSPSLSATLAPQLSSGLSVTDLGLAPEDSAALPDDMMDICKVEPDVDLDDHPVGPVVVNTVPSAPTHTAIDPVHLNSSPPLSSPLNNKSQMPLEKQSTTSSARSAYSSPTHGRHHYNLPPPPLLYAPAPSKPGFGQKLKYVFKPPRAASPLDDLRHLEVPEHIRNAYGTRRRQWSTTNGAATPRHRAVTPDSPTPPHSPPAPYLRRHSSESEGEDELLSDSELNQVAMRSPTPEPPLRSVSTPDLRSVSSLSDAPSYTRHQRSTYAKRKATQVHDDQQRQRPRGTTGERRMSQNRTAQKKYRDKNRRLADLRAEFNITALVLVERVSKGEISQKQAFSQLAGHSRVFKHHMKNTCGTTFERLMASVEDALNDGR